MPNTLAHIGIQSLASNALFPEVDLKWVYIGLIIPDVPWITQRLIRIFSFNVDLYDLRLYCIVQASLVFCLILSLALASLTKDFWKTFLILSTNSFFHLLLDATQIKWANGVHFFAPFSWKMVNLSLYWPDNLTTYILTVFGFIFFIITWSKSLTSEIKFIIQPLFRPFLFIAFIVIYYILPLFFLAGPENANNHYVKTLRFFTSRSGEYVEFERDLYKPRNSGGTITSFAGEEIVVEGIELKNESKVSARGNFISNTRVHIIEYHVHSDYFRSVFSYAGLFLVFFLWILFLFNYRGKKGTSK